MPRNSPILRTIEATPVAVPMRMPLGTSALSIATAHLVLIDLVTEEGITGHAYAYAYLGSIAQALAPILKHLGETLAGQPVVPRALNDTINRLFRLPGVAGPLAMAASSVDTAAWDVAAKAAGLPLATMLGGTPAPLRAYNSNGLGIMGPEAAADEALALVEGGFSAVKLRVGRPDFRQDLAAVRAVRKALSDDVALMVDFNQGLMASEALERCPALDHEGVYWIEEPIRHDDYASLSLIADRTRTPIQIGENFTGSDPMAAALGVGASDLVMFDLDRIGGVTGWIGAAGLAAGYRRQVSSHLFPEVSAHLLAATPGAHWLEYVDWVEPLLQDRQAIENGHFMIDDVPGNGLVWDIDAVRFHKAA